MSYQPGDLTEEEELAILEAVENNNYDLAKALGIEISIEKELENEIKVINIHYPASNNL